MCLRYSLCHWGNQGKWLASSCGFMSSHTYCIAEWTAESGLARWQRNDTLPLSEIKLRTFILSPDIRQTDGIISPLFLFHSFLCLRFILCYCEMVNPHLAWSVDVIWGEKLAVLLTYVTNLASWHLYTEIYSQSDSCIKVIYFFFLVWIVRKEDKYGNWSWTAGSQWSPHADSIHPSLL